MQVPILRLNMLSPKSRHLTVAGTLLALVVVLAGISVQADSASPVPDDYQLFQDHTLEKEDGSDSGVFLAANDSIAAHLIFGYLLPHYFPYQQATPVSVLPPARASPAS